MGYSHIWGSRLRSPDPFRPAPLPSSPTCPADQVATSPTDNVHRVTRLDAEFVCYVFRGIARSALAFRFDLFYSFPFLALNATTPSIPNP